MSKLLVIESSARTEGSVSRQLASALIEHLQALTPATVLTRRDVGAEPIPHLDADLLGGWMVPAEQQTPAQQAALARSNQLTSELQQADTLVLSLPMYNFGIPSTLKAWLDHVLRAGVTFKYTETGPVGLLEGKRAVVLSARGGIYAGTDLDQQTPYLRQALAFVGITDVTFIHAEGLNMGAEQAARGTEQALEQIAQYR